MSDGSYLLLLSTFVPKFEIGLITQNKISFSSKKIFFLNKPKKMAGKVIIYSHIGTITNNLNLCLFQNGTIKKASPKKVDSPVRALSRIKISLK